MDRIISVIRRCLKWKRKPESEEQNQARKILHVEGSNINVQSNSTTTSTSFSDPHYCSYDVFLSFRGEDTRKNFTDHLYSALVQLGIHTFRDDEELPRGKTISKELLSVIHGSKISIVIFSEGYASSRWCLDELVEIVRCKNTKGHTLFPIFYHVNPSDVRNQTGTFAVAFARHEERFQTDMEKVQRWKEALTDAANCSGWDLKCVANGYESRFIKENILEEILCKVNPSRLNVAKYPIGMESRVQDIKDLLNLGTSDVRIAGIYGMGGIGKTTLAKAVYNEICVAFEGSSFLSNFKESSEKFDGLLHLQEQILKDILKTNVKIDNVDRGISIIEERIRGKKVLVIVDDVDDFEKLHWLVEKEWLGPGSRIIVTTRDEHVLSPSRADKKYRVKELNRWESLRLLSWHAFKMTNPKEDYLELSMEAVDYAGGIPLALEVLGSLFKDRSVVEWKSELGRLQITPDDKIQKILRISFDSLKSPTNDIFLDIACFFVGMDQEYAFKILDGCNFFPGTGIPILIQRSLVTVDFQNKLMMHNLIRDMGREIVHQESPKKPQERSRLWLHEDVLNVLQNKMGSETVEGLILNHLGYEDVHLKTKAFTNMKNLRLLEIDFVHLTGSCEGLTKQLKWLRWHKCPMKYLPQNFHLENLVILDMQHSKVKQVWKKSKVFNKLKVLNLSNSKKLIKSPDFSQVPQLEILILEGCTKLVQVHKSIGDLKRLVLLNLRKCEKLRNLPSSFYNLESLKTLILSECCDLKKLPDYLGNMMALTELRLENTAIKRLPSSFKSLVNLETLSFLRCKRLIESPEFLPASRLKMLILAGCRSLVEVHKSIGFLKRLHFLDLAGCVKLMNLPSNIYDLELLETLSLYGCECLIESPEFLETSHLKILILAGCTSLVEVHKSIGLLERLVFLDLRGCKNLMNLPSNISNLEHLETLLWSDCLQKGYIIAFLRKMMELDILMRNGYAIRQPNTSSCPLRGPAPRCRRASSSWPSPKSSNRISVLPFISELWSMTWIQELDLSGRNLCEDDFPIEIRCLRSLRKLDLSRNNFRNLPNCCVPLLNELYLNECTNLQSISVHMGVQCLEANDCTLLERVFTLANESLGSLSFNNCHKFPRHRSRYGYFLMGRCNNLSPAFRESVLQMLCKQGNGFSIYLPGSEIPNWISHRTIGSSLSFRLPSYWGPGCKLLIWVVYASNKEAPRDFHLQEGFTWQLGHTSWTCEAKLLVTCEDHIVVETNDFYYLRDIGKSGDEIKFWVMYLTKLNECGIQVKKCGIHLVEEQDVIDEDAVRSYTSDSIDDEV